MRYNNLISPLTTLYGNLWHQSMYYVSYMTLYDIQEIFSTSMENQNYTVFSLWFFCMIPVWFLGNHIWSLYDYQEFIQIIYDLVKNHIWPITKSTKVVWSLTRVVLFCPYSFGNTCSVTNINIGLQIEHTAWNGGIVSVHNSQK